MKKILYLILFMSACINSYAQNFYTLDSCRNMAIQNNKKLLIADEKIKAAKYERKSARANFLPGIDAEGAYLYNQKDIHLISSQTIGELNHIMTGINGALDKILTPILPPSVIDGIQNSLGSIPGKLEEGTTLDIKNTFVGAVTVKQPLFMGGKIWAYHEITKYAEDLAESMKSSAVKDVIVEVDQTYWQVISLVYKQRMAESYVKLLETLTDNVEQLYDQGIATESDKLTVAVKLNEANIVLTKVNDGLSLTKMLLAQKCGLPVSTQFTLADEVNPPSVMDVPLDIDMNEVYAHRQEIISLNLAHKIYKKKEVIARSEMLPKVALMGNYLISNPSVLDGFQNEFEGMFSFGIGVSIPIWHWGKDYYKVKAAKSATRSTVLQLDEAKELIELQVNQAIYQAREANKTLLKTIANMNVADKNLQNAQFGYQEGVLTTQNVIEAQTAWLKAESEKIDAEIGIRLTQVYLSKAIGKNF